MYCDRGSVLKGATQLGIYLRRRRGQNYFVGSYLRVATDNER